MLEILNKFRKALTAPKQEAVFNGMSMNEVIQEIHETFYTEVDRLIESAMNANSLETDKQALIDKCKRLTAVGFGMTAEAKEGAAEIDRLLKLEKENEQKKELIEAINYFSFKYPHYKFITEESVKTICTKYGLVYGSASRYIGTIPETNLQHIEKFSIDEQDECWVYARETGSDFFGFEPEYGSIDLLEKYNNHIHNVMRSYPTELYPRGISSNTVIHSCNKCPLEIAAPQKDMIIRSHEEIRDGKIVPILDPVVLKPVVFNNRKYYLIVTAWGLEGADELVVNQQMN